MPNLFKFNAYKNIASNYSEALSKILSKGLVLGEPAVIPYYTDNITKNVELLFGIGSLDGKVSVFKGEDMDTSTGYKSIIYYGYGNDKISVMQNSVESSTPYRTYNVTITENDGQHIYIALPISMPVVRLDVNGSPVQTETEKIVINGQDYLLYSTIETFIHGDYKVIALNEYVESSAVLTAEPSIVMVGTDTIITLKVKCTTDADRVIVYDGSNNIINTGSGTFVQTAYQISPDTTGTTKFRAIADFGGKILNMETEISAVLRIYYGSGQTYESATTVAEKVSPSGVYKITVENDGDKFFFLIPKNIEILPITMSGFDVPMIAYDVDVLGNQYKAYESTNGYYAGIYNLVVDIPH